MTGITGIVNGMDVQEWNPLSDKYIDVKYDATNVMQAKPLLKEALQAHVGLPIRDVPVIGFIGRLEEQKAPIFLRKQFLCSSAQIFR
ncbi:E2F_TDP domain-containing protein [Psidium guajava]|nr:E2F_TDP domain-containing protein [Psidium guajava]